MNDALDQLLTTRVTRADRADIDALAAERGIEPLRLVRTLVREGIRRERFPGISFRSAPDGTRRAHLESHRLQVWQVVETLWASDGDVDATAATLSLRPDEVRLAVAYFAQYPEEVKDVIERNSRLAEELQLRAQREQAALRP